jgi:hypothetical protein
VPMGVILFCREVFSYLFSSPPVKNLTPAGQKPYWRDIAAMATSHCSACKHTFTSDTAFDLHRTGNFQQSTRCCLTEDEMRVRGMTRNARGWWSGPSRGKIPPWATHEELSPQTPRA